MKTKQNTLLSKFSYVKHKNYKYVLTADVKVKLHRDWVFKFNLIANGSVRAIIHNDILTILKGYAWDGCTGAPDFEGTLLGSLLHDVLFQFGALNLWTFDEANEIFYIQLKQENFKLAWVYYGAVCSFGRLFYGKDVVYKESLIPNEYRSSV